MLVPAEHADQKVRREPPREPGDGVDLLALEIAAEGVAIEVCAAHVDPGEPIMRRYGTDLRRLDGPGIAERGEVVGNAPAAAAAAVWRREKAVDVVLFRNVALRIRIGIEIVGEAAAVGCQRRRVARKADVNRIVDSAGDGLAGYIGDDRRG